MTLPNPYAPPTTPVADVESTTHGLKKRRVIVMILFAILTLGFYYPIWWFRRRPGLNRLNSPVKISIWPLLGLLGLFVVSGALGAIEGATGSDGPGEGANMLMVAFQLIVSVAMIIQAFRVKEIIEDHCAPEDRSHALLVEDVKLSGVMTFFFSIFYLQWAINRYVLSQR